MRIPLLTPLVAVAASLLFCSCIREEAANAECDIIAVAPEWLAAHSDILTGEAPVVKNNSVELAIRRGADVTALDPAFILTEGARIVPESGTVRDFSEPQTYTTYAADGVWRKDYTVAFKYNALADDSRITTFSFEHFDLDQRGQYYQYYEVDESDPVDGRRNYWDCGNAGFALTGKSKTPEGYPTAPLRDGYAGYGVRLETCATGSFGKMAGMPLAAGNLFIGEFDVKNAMKAPLEATRFGRQLVQSRPLRLEGYYRYTAGPDFQDKTTAIRPELHDTCDIYSVVFEVDPDNVERLDGSNVLSSDRIVLMARLDQPGEPAAWTAFSEPYRLMPGKAWDEARCAAGGYAITLVFSSSRHGAYFEGAVGSVLHVDEVSIVGE
ncbi:MAG: PCMD domain-containing protein [Bacteroidales bacterium]|nr:PCMD domain-containing protein [Candidatus Equimonas enterica]